ncbi:MAG: helix-turn-helix domain-containing protein [Anaerolineaceae bacterium]|nr:helix-turn-helix domain-containing protein [Anaerolineaceae bacterium]
MTTEKSEMWCATHLNNLALLKATYTTYAYKRHFHDYFAIGVIEDGVQTFSCNSAQYVNPAGGIFIIQPGEAHDGQSATDTSFTYSVFYPQVDDFQRIAHEMGSKSSGLPAFNRPVIQDKALSKRLLHLHQVLRQNTPRLEQDSAFIDTFAQLLYRHAVDHPQFETVHKESQTVARLRSYIEDHYADDIPLSDLARYANWSPFYLLRVFHQEVGLPPHAYLESIRIRAAQRLLEGERPLVDIAFETGFSSQSHFTNAFKRFIGITPGRYRAIFCKTREDDLTYTH